MVDLAARLERLPANAKVATVLGFDPSISGIWEAADEAVLNKVHENPKHLPVKKSYYCIHYQR
jgi:hypothetical protein